MTGYIAAAGMMAALLRRSIEGGSYHVKLSLTRSAMWVQDLGFLETATQKSLPERDTYPAKRSSIDSVYGKVSFLAPALAFSNLTLPCIKARALWGRCAGFLGQHPVTYDGGPE